MTSYDDDSVNENFRLDLAEESENSHLEPANENKVYQISEDSFLSELELLNIEEVEEEAFRLDFFEDDEDDEDDLEEEEEIDYKDILSRSRADLKEEDEYETKEIDVNATLQDIGSPEELIYKLEQVGYHCLPYLAAQVSLAINTKAKSIRSILLEGPPGCGKSFLAKSLAKLTGAEYMCLSCYPGMDLQQLVEAPSSMALAHAINNQGKSDEEKNATQLGVISRAFKMSQTKPVLMLVDELDKVHTGIDTFFLGPLQDAVIHLESGEVIEANPDNILIVLTKNYDRPLNDALLRRVQPITLTFLGAEEEKKILSNYCVPELITNLVSIADIMRYSDGAYRFERPPAPEELLKIGKYITQLLDWDIVDFTFIGRNIWQMLAKSENDRKVLELMLRYHTDFHDTLYPQGRNLTKDQVYKKLGREVLKRIVKDPEDELRKKAYKVENVGLTDIGNPQEIIKKLSEVKYECLPFLAVQIGLVLNTKPERVRTLLLEGPPGCGKSYLAKSIAKVTGAEFMCLSCYSGMNTQHLIESPSDFAIAQAVAKGDVSNKEDLVNLGILSRAFLKSQNQPVVLLVDELDKVDVAIDTFFLGPLQDGTIYLESRPPIDANLDNLLIFLTKNYERDLNDALLRRVHPIKMTYLNSDLERKILSENCSEILINNLVLIVDRMRYSGGSYGFDRPPAPEELKTIGNYVNKLLEWGITDFAEIGSNIWNMISKSEHDRAVLEHMMRFHPDFYDPMYPDARNLTKEQVHAKFGRIILNNIVNDSAQEQAKIRLVK